MNMHQMCLDKTVRPRSSFLMSFGQTVQPRSSSDIVDKNGSNLVLNVNDVCWHLFKALFLIFSEKDSLRFSTLLVIVAVVWVVPRGGPIAVKTRSYGALALPEACLEICLEAWSLCFFACGVRWVKFPCFVILDFGSVLSVGSHGWRQSVDTKVGRSLISPYVMGFPIGSTVWALEASIGVAMAHSLWARKRAMKLALQARNKYAFVDGTCVKSAYVASNILSSQWDRCNDVVLTWIMNSVSTDVYMGLVYFVDAATVWKDLEKLDTHNKLMKLMQFLMGLDDCYQSVRSSLLTRDPLPEVKDAYVNTRSNNNGNVNRGPNPNLSCKNCGMIGHTIERCYELIGYPPGFKKQSAESQNSSSSSFTPEQMNKLLNLINETSTGSIHSNMAGRASFFNGNAWFNINISKYFCGNNNLYIKTITLGWINDSGENQHLTVSTIGMSNIVDISNLKITIGHPNGTLATASHVGSLQLTKNVVLFDVLFVLGYCVSLLSVNKMIKDSKLFVGFDGEKCYIQDLKKEITLGTGSESGGLYLFNLKSDKNIGNVNMVHAFNVSKSLWHNRLSHPADEVLPVLKNDLNLSKSTDVSACEVYHRAKQTRQPFPLSDHKSKKVGDLIHLDLWGPYKVISREGFIYFLTVVDDFLRAVWVYLIKHKDEVFNEIVNFVKLIHNQFDTKINIMRSDNETEFVNKILNDFYNDLGITQQKSCVYTPQQNGIAERKHRHLLNVARSLMFQGEFLSSFGLIVF
ncbi:ribonuclease H-like domain-containing protein [Tanacetum coccineum]|uniref:Ribonuclease H-like domain-containing protein n=1 Tax=Tanacetum coccineum TaxID=301880 RepID=A0ABQ5BWB2_9ASTR